MVSYVTVVFTRLAHSENIYRFPKEDCDVNEPFHLQKATNVVE